MPRPTTPHCHKPRRRPVASKTAEITEAGEQRVVVRELRRVQIASGGQVRFFAVPNGGSRQRLEGARLKAQGVTAGVPDLLVVGSMPTAGSEPFSKQEIALLRLGTVADPPDSLVRRFLATLDAMRVTALEMKRTSGSVRDVSPEQQKWLEFFNTLPGGSGHVGYGAEDALSKLLTAGFPVRVWRGEPDVDDEPAV